MASLPLQRWKGLEHEELQYEGSRARARFPAGHADGRDRDDLASAARGRQGRGGPQESARVRQALAHCPGSARRQAREVRHLLLPGPVDLPRLPHGRLPAGRQETAHLGHGHRDEPGAPRLAAAGAKVIQIEEPTIHFTASFHPEQTELLDFMVEASTTRSKASTTSSCGSIPAGATRTCRRSTRASRTRTRSTSI